LIPRSINYSFQAYSSFGGSDNVRLLDHQPFTQIAQRYKCTVSQLLLSWALSQDFSVLPKSTNPDHIRANLQALNVKMSVEDVEAMKWEEGTKFCWNPKSVV
jgi:diketogulonate reductase-like aldo/keto reductase